jgi:hypothetical protein
MKLPCDLLFILFTSWVVKMSLWLIVGNTTPTSADHNREGRKFLALACALIRLS